MEGVGPLTTLSKRDSSSYWRAWKHGRTLALGFSNSRTIISNSLMRNHENRATACSIEPRGPFGTRE